MQEVRPLCVSAPLRENLNTEDSEISNFRAANDLNTILAIMRRAIAIFAAWCLAWLVYMVAMVLTVYDGLLSMIFQPIMAAIWATVAVVISLVLGLIFLVPPIGRAWRKAWFLSPALAVGSVILMCFGAKWGLTETYRDPETGEQWIGLNSWVALGSYLTMVFAVANYQAFSVTPDRPGAQ